MNVNDLTSLQSCKTYLGLNNNNSDKAITALITSESKHFLSLAQRSTFAPTTKNVILDGNGSDIMMLVDFPLIDVSSINIDGVPIPRAPLTPPPVGVGYFFDTNGRITLIGSAFVAVGGYSGSSGWGGSGGFWFTKARKNVFITYTFGFPAVAVVGELQNVPATAPFIITPANSSWVSDQGVKYFIGGTPLTRVFVAPAVGQYFIDTQTGQYTFNIADAGLPMLFSYSYLGVPEDVQQCANEMVAFTYGQRGSVGVSSETISGAAITTRLQDYPKFVKETIAYYKRRFRGPSS